MNVDEILSHPSRVLCTPLRANISLQQCEANRRRAWRAEKEGRRADMKDWNTWTKFSGAGMLEPCLRCPK